MIAMVKTISGGLQAQFVKKIEEEAAMIASLILDHSLVSNLKESAKICLPNPTCVGGPTFISSSVERLIPSINSRGKSVSDAAK